MLIKIIYVLMTYIVASIPFAYIFTKLFTGIDIRTVGSKNPGTTNVFRTAGKLAGTLTLVFDALKGFVPVFFASMIDADAYFIITVSFVAILGHMFTIFLNFKGGKGVATGLGVFLALFPFPALIAFGIFILIFLCSGYVAVASIIAALSIPLIAYLTDYQMEFVVFALIVGLLVAFKHETNIIRLINGTENKFNIFKRKGK